MDFTELTAYLDSLEGRFHIPCGDTAVYYKHRLVYRHMTGHSDFERTRDTTEKDMYLLWSATKPFTMVAVMRLIEEGKLALEDELCKYLPAYSEMQVRQADGSLRPAQRKIHIVDLMTMTSGMDYEFETVATREVLARSGGSATTRQIVDALAKTPLQFEPSTHWSYCLGHDVLGAVIEVVTGMSFGEYLKKTIFDPLGMPNTTFHPTAEQWEHVSDLYMWDAAAHRPRPYGPSFCNVSGNYESGGGGLISTVDDCLSFAACLANGGTADNGYRLLHRASIDLMRKNHLNDVTYRDYFNWAETPWRRGYGYGLGVRTMIDPDSIATHAPKGEFGWQGRSLTYFSIDPENDLAIFYGTSVLDWMEGYIEVHHAIRDKTYLSLGL